MKYEVVNYIEISGNGKDVRYDSLPVEQRRQLSQQMQDTAMEGQGFRRKQKKAG